MCVFTLRSLGLYELNHDCTYNTVGTEKAFSSGIDGILIFFPNSDLFKVSA